MLLLLLALSGSAAGQRLDPNKALTQYMLEGYDRFRGLPQNTVHCVLQSREGFLWVGTYLGLARFDGVSFQSFNLSNTPELGSNGIYSVVEDREGALWVGTNGGGVAQLHNGRWKRYTTAEGLVSNVVLRLYLDDRNRVWVGTRGGLSCIEGGKVMSVVGANALQGRAVRSFAEDATGAVWVGASGGLYRFASNRLEPFELSAQVGRVGNVFDLHVGPDGVLWLGTDVGLVAFDGVRQRLYTERDGLSDKVVNEVYVDHGGVLWAGTLRGGLNRFYQGRFERLNSSNSGLRDDKIQFLTEDREGNLWIGTEGAGLYRLREGLFLNYGRQEGYGADQTYAILESRSGDLLFGTYSGGVIRRTREGRFTTLSRAQGLPTEYVRSLHESADGTLWVGTYGEGLVPVRNGRPGKPITTRDGLADNYVRVVLDDGAGGLLIGTRNGLSHYGQGRIRNYTAANGLPTNSVLCMAIEPSKSSLWIGTDGGGLARLNLSTGRFDTLNTRKGLSSDIVMCLYRDPVDGSLWVGHNVGLDRVVEEGGRTRVQQFKGARGIYGESIFQILEDNRGALWMGSNNGVYRVNKAELLELQAGREVPIEVARFNEADGMRNAECRGNGSPSGIKTADGRLWFPTFAGVSAINPQRLLRNNVAPSVVIDGLEAEGKPQALDRAAVRVPAGVNKFEVEYTAPSFVAAEKVRFRYRLEGFDRDWVEAGPRRVAYYTNVPPGNYTFRVLAANSDGVWNETGAAVQISLEPTFWQTAWFYLLIGVLLVGMGYGFYRWRINELSARNDELEQLVTARTAQIEVQAHQLEAQAEQLRRSNDEILRHNRTMAEKNAELSTAIERLQQTQDHLIQAEKHAALGQLVAGVAHEINTPVGVSITAASELQRRVDELEDLLQRDELRRSDLERTMGALSEGSRILEHNLKRAAELIQSFKTVAVDQSQVEVRRVNLHEYLEEILTSLRVELRQAGATVELEGHPQLNVTVAAGVLTQVVLNLVLNALQHAFVAPGTDSPPPRILVRFALEGEVVVLDVADNGQGIAPELQHRVFDPFFTTARERGGSGLGLHIVYTLVTGPLRGNITLASTPERGTRFRISFPQHVEESDGLGQTPVSVTGGERFATPGPMTKV